MEFAAVNAYLTNLSAHGNPVLTAMEEEARQTRFPIIGPAAGQFCYLLARSIGARRVFEMGSGYGYSTAWFARAVWENGGGVVHHVVWDEGLSSKARRYLAEAGLDSDVRYTVGEAVETLRHTDDVFDIIFNDIDKAGYPSSIPVLKPKLRAGGLLIIDNMLWHGRIFEPNDNDEDTEGVRKVTEMLFADPDFACSLVPIRDGMIVALKVR
ncbi:O-methyltransferase [Candidatus Poribacteria bacterium]|nr:O-methyltransferase [Candidatus Poribacteria bacterium]